MIAREPVDGWVEAAGVAAQAAALRARAAELAEVDVAAYAQARRGLLDAVAERRGQPLRPLLHAAADVPFRIGETAADVAELAAEAARHGAPDRRPDAAVAAGLAEAAVRAASVLVEVNLAVSPDDDLAAQTRHDLAAASAARKAAEALVD